MPRGPAPMLPPRKRFVTPPHPEGRLQRHIKTPNFAAGIAQGRRESAFPRPFATCGCVSDAYTTHCPLLWGHVHTLSMFFRKICAKFSVFPLFPVFFRIFSGRIFRFSFNFSCFLTFPLVFSVFTKTERAGPAAGQTGPAFRPERPAPALTRWQAYAPAPCPRAPGAALRGAFSAAGRLCAARSARRAPTAPCRFGACAAGACPRPRAPAAAPWRQGPRHSR